MTLTPILQKLYPSSSRGGECGIWCERLADFGPIGNSLAQKKHYVDLYGIIMGNVAEIGKGFRVGDILITTESSTNGHVAIIVDLVNGQPVVGESNFNLDGRVHYGRIVPLNKIYGIIRAPLKIDVGALELNVAVFINNQKWDLGIFDDIKRAIFVMTHGKLSVNFFPVLTSFANWWYQDFPFNGVDYKVIAKEYLDEKVREFSFTNQNKPADVCVFMIRPDQWQGSAGKLQEIAWTSNGRPGVIQGSCGEFDQSPYYFGMRLSEHIIRHELSHWLHYINGLNDPTDQMDFNKQIDHLCDDLDFKRIKLNI